MNDYLGTSHEAIYDMVQQGEPFRSQTWATDIARISRDLGSQLSSLREQCVLISSVWSDGVGSVRLTTDLGAVIDYLQVIADGLSGQSASYADITVQAAADLSAAQPPSALPPPPARSPAELRAEMRAKSQQIGDPSMDPGLIEMQTAQMARQIALNQAAWIKAGETATTLDNGYRTALARLTPPPEPPAIVLDAATAGGGIDPPAATGSAAAVAVSAGGSTLGAASAAPVGGWSVDRYLAGGPAGGVDSPGQGGLVGSSLHPLGPVGTVNSTGTTQPVGLVPGAGPAGVTGSGVPDWSGGGVISAGMLSGGAAGSGYRRPRVDPVSLHGGIWDGSVNAGSAGLGTGGAAADQLAHGSLKGAGAVAAGFDPVTGSAITAGPGRIDTVGVSADGSGWETATGVGGIAALAAGAALLSRGGAGAVTAAGLSGGFGTGVGGSGVGVSGASAGGGSGVGGGSGSAAGGVSGSGAGGYGAGSTGASAAAGSARGLAPGMSGAGSNSMVQGGQIGQTGRGMSGATGAGVGRPGAPGSGIGGEHGYRVTWLMEDRDLYGRSPSVKSVIEASPELKTRVD